VRGQKTSTAQPPARPKGIPDEYLRDSYEACPSASPPPIPACHSRPSPPHLKHPASRPEATPCPPYALAAATIPATALRSRLPEITLVTASSGSAPKRLGFTCLPAAPRQTTPLPTIPEHVAPSRTDPPPLPCRGRESTHHQPNIINLTSALHSHPLMLNTPHHHVASPRSTPQGPLPPRPPHFPPGGPIVFVPCASPLIRSPIPTYHHESTGRIIMNR
jgi:hypothetical protein